MTNLASPASPRKSVCLVIRASKCRLLSKSQLVEYHPEPEALAIDISMAQVEAFLKTRQIKAPSNRPNTPLHMRQSSFVPSSETSKASRSHAEQLGYTHDGGPRALSHCMKVSPTYDQLSVQREIHRSSQSIGCHPRGFVETCCPI